MLLCRLFLHDIHDLVPFTRACTYQAAAGHTYAVGVRKAAVSPVDDRAVESRVEAETHGTAVEGTRVWGCQGEETKLEIETNAEIRVKWRKTNEEVE